MGSGSRRAGGVHVDALTGNGGADTPGSDAFPERMRQMGECARADYYARFIANRSYPRLLGERRRSPRL